MTPNRMESPSKNTILLAQGEEPKTMPTIQRKYSSQEQAISSYRKTSVDIYNLMQRKQLHRIQTIGICGGIAAGKSQIAREMQEYLKTYKKDVLLLRQQDFYLEHEKLENYNYDSPNSIDWKLMEAVISKIKAKCPVRLPKWDMQTEKRTLTEEQSYNDYIIIVDGTFIYSKQANLNIDFKIYLDTDEDIRLSRRIQAEVLNKKRDLRKVVDYYLKYVKPDFEKYTLPSKQNADVILPNVGGMFNLSEDDNKIIHSLDIPIIQMVCQQLLNYGNPNQLAVPGDLQHKSSE